MIPHSSPNLYIYIYKLGEKCGIIGLINGIIDIYIYIYNIYIKYIYIYIYILNIYIYIY